MQLCTFQIPFNCILALDYRGRNTEQANGVSLGTPLFVCRPQGLSVRKCGQLGSFMVTCLTAKLSRFLVCRKLRSLFSCPTMGRLSSCHACRTILVCLKYQLMSALSSTYLSINGCLQGLETIQITSGRIIIVLVATSRLFHGHTGLGGK